MAQEQTRYGLQRIGSREEKEMTDNGVNIDYRYIIRVKDYMPLPRPEKRLLDSDGSVLPLISISVEE